jgi:hypothetical protein
MRNFRIVDPPPASAATIRRTHLCPGVSPNPSWGAMIEVGVGVAPPSPSWQS